MDALKVYDVRKNCDARLYIVDMVAAFVRALATVLMMGRVVVLYRYRAVPVALLCAQVRRSSSPAALCTRRLAARPLAVRAASLRLGASVRSPARPCRRPRAPQPAAYRRGTLPPPSGTAVAGRVLHGRHTTHPGLVPALAPVLAVGLAMNIQNRRDQTVPAIHRRGGGI